MACLPGWTRTAPLPSHLVYPGGTRVLDLLNPRAKLVFCYDARRDPDRMDRLAHCNVGANVAYKSGYYRRLLVMHCIFQLHFLVPGLNLLASLVAGTAVCG